MRTHTSTNEQTSTNTTLVRDLGVLNDPQMPWKIDIPPITGEDDRQLVDILAETIFKRYFGPVRASFLVHGGGGGELKQYLNLM